MSLYDSLIPNGTLYGILAIGAGTTDYNALDNKPQINGTTLSGNKTGSDLGLVNSSDLAPVATSNDYEDLNNKPTIPDITVYNVGSQYSSTKTSGEWVLNSIWARKCNNMVSISIYFGGNGNTTLKGSNAFKGTISGGPLPIGVANIISYIDGAAIICQINSEGNVTVRITGDDVTLASGNSAGCSGVFMTTP